MYRDNGAGGLVDTEVNTVNDPAVRDIPTLRELDVTNFTGVIGSSIRFLVTAFNLEGSTNSSISSILLAGPPLAPLFSPDLIENMTSDT